MTKSSASGSGTMIKTAAEKALGAAWDGTVRLDAGEAVGGSGPRSSVSRWRVLDSPSCTDADLAAVTALWTMPGSFLAYTHGDPAPGNEMQTATSRKLLDFDFGGYRHVLTEGVYARMQFVTGWYVNRLPDPVVRQTEAAYRAELVQGCPEAGDDASFFHAIVESCAYTAICMLSWAMPGVLDADEDWGLATYRQRLLRRLDIVTQAAAEFGHLEALGATAGTMAAKLRTLWPPEADAMAYYPAFR